MSQTYPQLKFSGTAQEVAEQTATQLQSSIEELIDFRERILHTHFGVSSVPKALHAPIEDAHRACGGYSVIEAEAIAKVTGRHTGEIIALSGLSDLMDYLGFVGEEEWGCSSLLFGPQRTDDIAFVQTWDLHRKIEDLSFVIERDIEGYVPHLTLTTALGHTHFGVNQHGVCIGTNNLQSTKPTIGVVFACALQRALEQATSAVHAKEILSEIPLMSAHNYVAADLNHTFNIERTAHDVVVHELSPTEGFAHANHFVDGVLGQEGRIYSPTSKARHAYLAQFQAPDAWSEPPGLQDLHEVFSDHEAAICRHAERDEETATCGTLAFHPARRAISIIKGVACQGHWHSYTLSSLFAAKT